MKKHKFSVDNISNNTAKNQLKNAIHKIDGVNGVLVNRQHGTVTVEYNTPATSDVIENCIEHCGHNAK